MLMVMKLSVKLMVSEADEAQPRKRLCLTSGVEVILPGYNDLTL